MNVYCPSSQSLSGSSPWNGIHILSSTLLSLPAKSNLFLFLVREGEKRFFSQSMEFYGKRRLRLSTPRYAHFSFVTLICLLGQIHSRQPLILRSDNSIKYGMNIWNNLFLFPSMRAGALELSQWELCQPQEKVSFSSLFFFASYKLYIYSNFQPFSFRKP